MFAVPHAVKLSLHLAAIDRDRQAFANADEWELHLIAPGGSIVEAILAARDVLCKRLATLADAPGAMDLAVYCEEMKVRSFVITVI